MESSGKLSDSVDFSSSRCSRSTVRKSLLQDLREESVAPHPMKATGGPPSSRWWIVVVTIALGVAWGVLAVWQHEEYVHERSRLRDSLARQADAVITATIGGARAHRRMGRFFQTQLQATLDEMAKGGQILAVAIATDSGGPIVSGGDKELVESVAKNPPGYWWLPEGLAVVSRFEIAAESDRGPRDGRGSGWGMGFGRGGGRLDEEPGPFSAGGSFRAILVLDRRATDEQTRRALLLRESLVGAGGLVLLLLGLAWFTSVRLLQARAHARLLEAEGKYWKDLGQTSAGLAHEIKNPLGLVRGWTQRLSESDQIRQEHREQARSVLEECDRIAARVNQFLTFARPVQPGMEPVELAGLVEELSMIMEPDLESRGVRLWCVASRNSKGSVTVAADREMLRQALFNLIRNAIRFSPDGETVEVELVKTSGGRLRLEVSDRGAGVPEEAREKLFTPYFTTRPDGTGLGLSIVRRIARSHGWVVGFAPRLGGGATFYLDGLND